MFCSRCCCPLLLPFHSWVIMSLYIHYLRVCVYCQYWIWIFFVYIKFITISRQYYRTQKSNILFLSFFCKKLLFIFSFTNFILPIFCIYNVYYNFQAILSDSEMEYIIFQFLSKKLKIFSGQKLRRTFGANIFTYQSGKNYKGPPLGEPQRAPNEIQDSKTTLNQD